jgi:tRNA nucleotidyltransferase/poly(A) polymerase
VRIFIERSAEEIKKTPAERWGREIVSGMRQRPYDFIYLCDRYHLLPLFLDDLEQLKDIQTEEGVTLFAHTMDTLRLVQKFLASRKRREHDMVFSLAMLFHHAGAEKVQPIDKDNKTDNKKKAAEIATRYLRSWNVNSETTDSVAVVIRNYHLAYTTRTEEQLCESVLKYGFEAVDMVIDFATCNAQADGMKNIDVLAANKWSLGEVNRRFEEAKRRTEGNTRYLTGDEVMKTLDIKPGRVVGEILHELGMAVGTGIVSSKKEAQEWILHRGAIDVSHK